MVSGIPEGDHGKGSWPWPPQGLHERKRFKVSQPPLKGPYFRIACRPYSEQVGVYLHAGGISGDIAFL